MPANVTQFKEKYIDEVDRYLRLNKDRTVKVVEMKNEKNESVKYSNKVKVKLPTIYGFATYLGVVEKTVYNWANENPEFKRALRKIKSEQKQRLINMGLSGEYNSTIAKLLLSSNHGMKERVDNTTADKPINNFNDEQIDRIAERISRRKGNDGGAPGTEKLD